MAVLEKLDKDAIVDRLGGDEDLFRDMAELYVQESGGYCDNLQSATRNGDARALAREAHTLKSLLATFSDDDGAAMAIAIEQRAKAADLAGIEVAVVALVARVQSLAGLLKREFDLA